MDFQKKEIENMFLDSDEENEDDFPEGHWTEEDITLDDWNLVRKSFTDCSERYSKGFFLDDSYKDIDLKTKRQIDIDKGEEASFALYLANAFKKILDEDYTVDGNGLQGQTEFIKKVIYAKSYNKSIEECIKPTIWNWLERNYEEAKEKVQRKYKEEEEESEHYEYLYRLGLSYQDFLQEPYWKDVRNKIIERDKRCRTCGDIDSLEVHHITYKNRGNELNHLEDLTLLCRNCHQLIHDNCRGDT